jgi:group I intron endonuclease
MLCGIYLIRCVSNNKVYIGSSSDIQGRFSRHKNELRKQIHHNSHLQRAYDKYGIDSFVYSIIELCKFHFLIEREQFWIDLLNSANRSEGFNLCIVADRRTYLRNTEESKRKLSRTLTGRKASKETKTKMSRSATGENNPAAILSEDQVLNIKRRLANGDKCGDIASAYFVDTGLIHSIRRGSSWSHIVVPNSIIQGHRKGEGHFRSKLNHDIAAQIRHSVAVKFTNKEIALRFNISPTLVSDIRTGKAWSDFVPH